MIVKERQNGGTEALLGLLLPWSQTRSQQNSMSRPAPGLWQYKNGRLVVDGPLFWV